MGARPHGAAPRCGEGDDEAVRRLRTGRRRRGGRGAAGAFSGGLAEELVADALLAHAEAEQDGIDRLHERRGAAQVDVVVVEGEEGLQDLAGHQSGAVVVDADPVAGGDGAVEDVDAQRRRRGGQRPQLGAVGLHLAPLAGVDEPRPAPGPGQVVRHGEQRRQPDPPASSRTGRGLSRSSTKAPRAPARQARHPRERLMEERRDAARRDVRPAGRGGLALDADAVGVAPGGVARQAVGAVQGGAAGRIRHADGEELPRPERRQRRSVRRDEGEGRDDAAFARARGDR